MSSFLSDRLPLVLGTAQLGRAYGIANSVGKLDAAGQRGLLDAATGLGITMIDTAAAYGEAEAAIGRWLREKGEGGPAVISKLRPEVDVENPDEIVNSVRASISLLGKPLAGLLIHNPASLAQWSRGLGQGLLRCRDLGMVGHLGVSTYTPQDFRAALEIDALTIIQAPFNVLDQRLRDTGLLDKGIANGKHLFIRSVLLQGLLMLDDRQLPSHMAFAKPTIRRWLEVCSRHAADPAETALRFVRDAIPQGAIVVGCETAAQLGANVKSMGKGALPSDLRQELEALSTKDEALIDPRKWAG
jgi:aryl-alcohol dehydrogenase-like predicted oxidoreductase